MHLDVFDSPNLAPMDGELYWLRQFYGSVDADQYFQQLQQSLNWHQEQLFIYGRWLIVPRLMAWYGDALTVIPVSIISRKPGPAFWLNCVWLSKRLAGSALTACWPIYTGMAAIPWAVMPMMKKSWDAIR